MVLENFLIDVDVLWDRAGKELYEKPDARAGRKMRVRVTNKGLVEDLTGYALNLGWRSTIDETKFGLDAFTAVDITKGIFELPYTSGMLTNIGTLLGTLQLVPPAGTPTESNNFMITVKRSGVDVEAIQSENSFTALETALVEVTGWNARIDDVEQDFIDRANNLDATYPTRLVSVEQQLEHAENQLDAFVVEQSSGMTDTGSLELIQTRVNSGGIKFPVATRRIDYVERILTTENINMVNSNAFVGLYPAAGTGWAVVDAGEVETICLPASNTYPFQRYRFNAELNHKYLLEVKVKGSIVTNFKLDLLSRIANLSTSIPGNWITGFSETTGTKTAPFDFIHLARTITITNVAQLAVDFTLSITQPNLDTEWAYKEVRIIDVTDKNETEIITLLNAGYERYGTPSVNTSLITGIPTKTSDLTNDSGFLTVAQQPKFYGKNILAIGDSLTAALQWQLKVAALQGCTITTHAKGGIGFLSMVDGTTGLAALTSSQLTGKSSIILFGGMNERSTPYGVQGDLWPTNNTVYGKIQYVINKLYELLATAGNLTCQILVVAPHCPGKYDYINADGYAEYPVGTGQTLELLVGHIKKCAQYNNLPVVDLWHDSGIGKNTWGTYTANTTADNTAYTKYELDSAGNVIGVTPLSYVNGTSYYQMVGGVPTLVQYTGSSPYPYNRDQLHLNNTNGYPRIGEIISEALNRI